MEKQELQRKITATVVATVVLCALLGVSIWLLLTTDVFPPLIKGLMVACCVLLAAAIAGFLRNKLVEIRTLRLCIRDPQPQHEYSEIYGEDDSSGEAPYLDSAQTISAPESEEADFFAPSEDVFAAQEFSAFDEEDFSGAAQADPKKQAAAFFPSAEIAQPPHTAVRPAAAAASAFADGLAANNNPTIQAVQNGEPRTAQLSGQPAAHGAAQRPTAPATQPMQQPAGTQLAEPARPVAAATPSAAQAGAAQASVSFQSGMTPASTPPRQPAVQSQRPVQAQQPTAAQPQPARAQSVADFTAQPTAAAQPGVAQDRPLSRAQQQAIAYNAQMAQAQASQRAATIAAAQERARALQMAQESSLHRHVQERAAAQLAAQQRIASEQAAAQQQAVYLAAQAARAQQQQQVEADGLYRQNMAAAHATPQPDPQSEARAAQAAAAARAAAQLAEREAMERSKSANAAAQSAEESAGRATEAAARAEARLRALVGLSEEEVPAPAAQPAAPAQPAPSPTPMAEQPIQPTVQTTDAAIPKKTASWLADAENAE